MIVFLIVGLTGVFTSQSPYTIALWGGMVVGSIIGMYS